MRVVERLKGRWARSQLRARGMGTTITVMILGVGGAKPAIYVARLRSKVLGAFGLQLHRTWDLGFRLRG